MQVIDVPLDDKTLARYTERVLKNNGLVPQKGDEAAARATDIPIPSKPGVASHQIKHVVFITKENLTHDLVLGDILQTRAGRWSTATPAWRSAPTPAPTTTSWPCSSPSATTSTSSRRSRRTATAGWSTTPPPSSRRPTGRPRTAASGATRATTSRSSRTGSAASGFTDANGSPDPHDYPQHGSLFMHLHRNGKSFINFGEGYEFAIVDEDARHRADRHPQHVNVPMEKVLRDNTDHLFPQYNTTIPDAPLPEDPDRFSRFGRFAQVFKAQLREGRRVPPAGLHIHPLSERPRRRGQRHQRPGRPALGLQALRAGQRRRPGADGRAHLQEPLLERHGHLRDRGRHPERAGPRRRLPHRCSWPSVPGSSGSTSAGPTPAWPASSRPST